MDLHELQEYARNLNYRIENNTDAIRKLETIIEKVSDRVPPWIIIIMTGMGALLGSFLSIIFSAKR